MVQTRDAKEPTEVRLGDRISGAFPFAVERTSAGRIVSATGHPSAGQTQAVGISIIDGAGRACVGAVGGSGDARPWAERPTDQRGRSVETSPPSALAHLRVDDGAGAPAGRRRAATSAGVLARVSIGRTGWDHVLGPEQPRDLAAIGQNRLAAFGGSLCETAGGGAGGVGNSPSDGGGHRHGPARGTELGVSADRESTRRELAVGRSVVWGGSVSGGLSGSVGAEPARLSGAGLRAPAGARAAELQRRQRPGGGHGRVPRPTIDHVGAR